MRNKFTVGIFSLSSCEGCLVQLINLDDRLLKLLEHIEIVDCRILGVKKDYDKMNIAIVEGSVTSLEEREKLEKIREKADILVALGDCACSGGKFLVKDFDISEARIKLPGSREVFRSDPLDKYVKVDFYLWGCPVNKDELFSLLRNILLLKHVKERAVSVCAECVLRENNCLIELGYPCLGPITRGGCNALCPSNNKVCFGCRGLAEDANIDSLIEIFEQHKIEVPEYLRKLKALMEAKKSDKRD